MKNLKVKRMSINKWLVQLRDLMLEAPQDPEIRRVAQEYVFQILSETKTDLEEIDSLTSWEEFFRAFEAVTKPIPNPLVEPIPDHTSKNTPIWITTTDSGTAAPYSPCRGSLSLPTTDDFYDLLYYDNEQLLYTKTRTPVAVVDKAPTNVTWKWGLYGEDYPSE